MPTIPSVQPTKVLKTPEHMKVCETLHQLQAQRDSMASTDELKLETLPICEKPSNRELNKISYLDSILGTHKLRLNIWKDLCNILPIRNTVMMDGTM